MLLGHLLHHGYIYIHDAVFFGRTIAMLTIIARSIMVWDSFMMDHLAVFK